MTRTEQDWLEQVVAAEEGSPIIAGGRAADPSLGIPHSASRSLGTAATIAFTEAILVVLAGALWFGVDSAMAYLRQAMAEGLSPGVGGVVDSVFIPTLQGVFGVSLILVLVLHLAKTASEDYREFFASLRRLATSPSQPHGPTS